MSKMDRQVAFKSLVGSQNYNLATVNSDRDYKTFLYPTFTDLYNSKMIKGASVTTEEDNEYHDVRKLQGLLAKSNVNFIEVLFSKEVVQADSLFNELKDIREDIAKMNLPYLFDASAGMFNKEVKMFNKFLQEDDWMRASKFAASAIRIGDFLVRYTLTEFLDFGWAIRYEDDDSARKVILNIKNGQGTVEKINNLLGSVDTLIGSVKQKYKVHEKDTDTEKKLEDIVLSFTKYNIKQEIQ